MLPLPDIDLGYMAKATFYLLWAAVMVWALAWLWLKFRNVAAGVEDREATTRIHKAEAGTYELELAEREVKYARATATTSTSDTSSIPEEYQIAREMMIVIVGEGANLPCYWGKGWGVTRFIRDTLRREDGRPVVGGPRFSNAAACLHGWAKEYRALQAQWKQD